MNISELANQLNVASVDYKIGHLQEIRKKIHHLKRRPCSSIFRPSNERYEFHVGSREHAELQFNIGIDRDDNNKEVVRHGVAFPLQPSQTLQDYKVFIPKIERFNEYVSSHLEDFPKFSMWNYQDSNGGE